MNRPKYTAEDVKRILNEHRESCPSCNRSACSNTQVDGSRVVLDRNANTVELDGKKIGDFVQLCQIDCYSCELKFINAYGVFQTMTVRIFTPQ